MIRYVCRSTGRQEAGVDLSAALLASVNLARLVVSWLITIMPPPASVRLRRLPAPRSTSLQLPRRSRVRRLTRCAGRSRPRVNRVGRSLSEVHLRENVDNLKVVSPLYWVIGAADGAGVLKASS